MPINTLKYDVLKFGTCKSFDKLAILLVHHTDKNKCCKTRMLSQKFSYIVHLISTCLRTT